MIPRTSLSKALGFISVGLLVVLVSISVMFAKTNKSTDMRSHAETPSARTYFVSTSGNDSNPGTIDSPFRTIQKGIDMTGDGDTVYVRGGTYSEGVKITYKKSTTGQYRVLSSYNGEQAVIDGTNIPSGDSQAGLVHITGSSYIRITGLKIQHSNMAGIYTAYSDHLTIENNITHDTYKSGISAWFDNYVIITGNDISLACNKGSEEDLKLDGTSNAEVSHNRVHDGYGYGQNISQPGGEGLNISGGDTNTVATPTHDIKVHHNIVYNLPKFGIGITAWKNRIYNVEIYDNIAYNCDYHGFIVTLDSPGSGTIDTSKIYNNIAYNNKNAGFAIPWWSSGNNGGAIKDIQFMNNVSYNNGGAGFLNSTMINQNVAVKNNIFSNNGSPVNLGGYDSQFVFDHNLFYGSGGTYGTNAISADPKFVNAASHDFHLQSNSPAINAGLDVIDQQFGVNAPTDDFDGNSRPQGTGYDIGAYEYASGQPQPTATVAAAPTTTSTPNPTATPYPTSPSTITQAYNLPTATPYPTATSVPPPSSGSFTGTYFNNRSLQGTPVLTRQDAAINFSWGRNAPAPGMSSNYFSVRWVKEAYFAGGAYQFAIRSDDGLKLYVDNVLVYSSWKNQSAKTKYANANIATGYHTVKVEYYENTGLAEAKVSW